MANTGNGPPARPKTRSLSLQFWPEADRDAWAAAIQPARRLKCGGAAGHLKPVTRDDHAREYGNFLGFLDRAGLLRLEGPVAVNVTADNVDAYHTEIKERLSSVSVHGSICKLRRAAQYIAPGCDFAKMRRFWPGDPESRSDGIFRNNTALEKVQKTTKNYAAVMDGQYLFERIKSSFQNCRNCEGHVATGTVTGGCTNPV